MARPKGSKSRKKKANGTEQEAAAQQQAAGADDLPHDGHNSQAVDDVIRDAANNIRALRVEVAALREQTKAKNKQIANEFRRVKSVGGIDREIMEEAIHRADLEPKNYEKTFAMMRTAYHALGVGEMVDWIQATADTVRGQPQPKEEEAVTTKTARAAGRETGRAGKSATLNPHGKGSDLYDAWNAGHLEGTADNLPEKGSAAPAIAPGDPFGPAETVH